MDMATGMAPASFSAMKARDNSLNRERSLDFVKVKCLPDSRRIEPHKVRAFTVKNSNPGQGTVELQPASEGSPLLGIKLHLPYIFRWIVGFFQSTNLSL